MWSRDKKGIQKWHLPTNCQLSLVKYRQGHPSSSQVLAAGGAAVVAAAAADVVCAAHSYPAQAMRFLHSSHSAQSAVNWMTTVLASPATV
jgi:alcohol dehydrogenase YqhD (iron-dependent ADH family)